MTVMCELVEWIHWFLCCDRVCFSVCDSDIDVALQQ